MRLSIVRMVWLAGVLVAGSAHANSSHKEERKRMAERAAARQQQAQSAFCEEKMVKVGPADDFEPEVRMFREISEIAPLLFTPEELAKKRWHQAITRYVLPNAQSGPAFVLMPIADSNVGATTFVNYSIAVESDVVHQKPRDFVPIERDAGTTQRATLIMSEAAAKGQGGNHAMAMKRDVNERFLNPGLVDEAGLCTTGPTCVHAVPSLPASSSLVFGNLPGVSLGSVDEDYPRFLKAIVDAVIPADALVVFLDSSRYASQTLKKSIRAVFDAYGVRPCVFVWTEDAEGVEDIAVAQMSEFGQQIFGEAPGPTGLPPGVVGAYWVPRDKSVREKLVYPTYHAFPNFREYSDLLDWFNTKPKEITQYGMRHARRQIEKDLIEVVRNEYHQRYAMKIWATAIQAKIATFSQELEERIPYAQVRDEVRNTFIQMRSGQWHQVVHKGVSIFISAIDGTGKLIARALKKAGFQMVNTATVREALTGADSIKSKLSILISSLERGQVALLKDPPRQDPKNARLSGRLVKALSKKFEEYAPGSVAHPNSAFAADEDQLRTDLPRLEYLSPRARAAIEADLFRMDVGVASQQLQETLESFSANMVAHLRRNPTELINAIRERSAFKDISTQAYIDYSTVALLGWGGYMNLVSSAEWHNFYALGLVIGAHQAFKFFDRKRNRAIEMATQDAFASRQYEETRDFMMQRLGRVLRVLQVSDPRRMDAIARLEEILSAENPNLARLPADIEDTIDKSAVEGTRVHRLLRRTRGLRPPQSLQNLRLPWANKP